jgi:hypothetical protein
MDANPKDFELTQSERIALMGLTTHPGWPVLNTLMEKVCRQFDVATIREEDDEKARKLRYEARAANAFSSLLGKVVSWNVQCAKVTNVKEIA